MCKRKLVVIILILFTFLINDKIFHSVPARKGKLKLVI
jgi:hypothetical protein